MGKFKNAIYRFMYGRYGGDTLNNVLIFTYLGLFVVHSVVFSFVKEPLVVRVVYLLVTAALVFAAFYRMMSRNIYKRRKENEKFTSIFKLIRNRFRDRKTHIYRKCKHCRAVLRLPKARGKHTVVCPRCKTRFSVRG